MKPQYFNAEKTSHPSAAEHRWAIVYDPTPAGLVKENGLRSFSMRFPVLLLTDYIEEPEKVAAEIALALNEARWRAEEATGEVAA